MQSHRATPPISNASNFFPDKNECDAFQCDFKSTVCENAAGSYHCMCKEGFTPNLECRPTLVTIL
jgi:hypothetical protein